ncbi:hypothetical protein [Rhodoferax sp. PAMC 29310]|uniref:hypothetical protein n=1 Tax=Rhodoferax sp. PAMC 29310 TaxID=2822760 RepID=UPI001B33054D|nr:hypothetical protein [Rhodoferax sp. PAMC 29310]
MTPKKLVLILIAAGLAVAATSAAFGLPPYSWLGGGAMNTTDGVIVRITAKEWVGCHT